MTHGVSEHKTRLDRYLAEAAAANRPTKTLATFSRILSLASLAAQASATLREGSEARIDSAYNAQELIEGVKKRESIMNNAAGAQEKQQHRITPPPARPPMTVS